MCANCSRRCARRGSEVFNSHGVARLTETRLQRFHCEPFDKFAGRLGVEQPRSRGFILHQARQSANANQVIVHQPFRHADYKNQSRALLICADWNPGAAAPDTDNYFINQIGARMRKRDAVFDYAWVFPFAGEDLFEKSFCIIDLSTLREHLNNLAQRIRQFSRAQPQNYLSFIEKISERDSHWAERDLLDYPAKPVIQ